MTVQSWEAAAAGMSKAQQLDALARELGAADMALALQPKSRRWRRYRRDVLAIVDRIDPAPACSLSDDELMRELGA